MIICLLVILAGIANAISEASNQNALGWIKNKWWDGYNTNSKNFPLWMQYGPGVIFRDAFHFFKVAWVVIFCWTIVYAFTGKLFGFSFCWFFDLFVLFVLFSGAYEGCKMVLKLIKKIYGKK